MIQDAFHDNLRYTTMRRDLCLILFLDKYYTAKRRDLEIIISLSWLYEFSEQDPTFSSRKVDKWIRYTIKQVEW